MESSSAIRAAAATETVFPGRSSPIPVRTQTFGTRRWQSRFALSSKRSEFQDYQQYAKPTRLLPSKEAKICSEKIVHALGVDGSPQVLYAIKLRTSSNYGSGLSDWSAGVLLCLINGNGDSLLQRISAGLTRSIDTDSAFVPDDILFQRASVAEFLFEGPELGEIKALWVGLESGQWRLGGVSLKVVGRAQPPGGERQSSGTRYEFDFDDVLLGEGSGVSMVELRPSIITELSDLDSLAAWSDEGAIPSDPRAARAESMKEYADLKSSMLLYDAVLVFSGAVVISSAGEEAAVGFLTGGIGGFLFLLVLQRWVDELPVSAFSSGKATGRGNPARGFAILSVLAIAAVCYRWGRGPAALTAEEIVAGMVGFLACKAAVVLAAAKTPNCERPA